jgi:hypothetical protein
MSAFIFYPNTHLTTLNVPVVGAIEITNNIKIMVLLLLQNDNIVLL